MAQKVEIPTGSGKYYAYKKVEGKSTYVGTWTDHVREIKLQDYFQELFTKNKPIETEVMVTTKNMRFFKNKNLTEEEIGRAVNDLRDYTKISIGSVYPEYQDFLKTVFISDEDSVQDISLVEPEGDFFTTNLLQIRVPQELVPKLVQCRKTPDEDLETVLMRLGDERKGIDEAIQKELTLHHIKYKYEYPIDAVDNEVVVRVPSEEKALELEDDLKQREVSLTTDVLYKSLVAPKKIRLEVG